MSTSTLCRVCVSEQSELVNMLNLYYGSTPATTFIMDILQIKVDSEGSSALVMCSSCNTTLNNFYTFYNMVRDAQHKYNQVDGILRCEKDLELLNDNGLENGEMLNDLESSLDVEIMKQLPSDSVSYVINTDGYEVSIIELPNRPKILTTSVLVKRPAKERKNAKNKKTTKEIAEKIRQNIQTRVFAKRKQDCDGSQGDETCLNDEKRRINRATEFMLERYSRQEIVRRGKIVLNQDQRHDMFSSYLDFQCSDCDEPPYSNYKQLELHCLQSHGQYPRLMCCRFYTRSADLMEKHIVYRHILKHKGT